MSRTNALTTVIWPMRARFLDRHRTDDVARSADDDAPAERLTEARLRQWFAIGGSLLFHAVLLLILAAWLLPLPAAPERAVIQTTMQSGVGLSHALETIDLGALEVSQPDGPSEQVFALSASRAAASERAEDSIEEIPIGLPAGAAKRIGGAADDDGGTVGFFGTEAAGRSFVFIVDFSSSMRGHRFSRARDELIRALADLTPRQKFFIYFYNHEAHPMYVPGRKQQLMPAKKSVLRRACRWIMQQRAGGATVPDGALEMALGLEPDIIFLLSDGDFARTARLVAREANRHGTVIHTIAFEYKGGEVLLKGIAEDSHGRYRFVE